MTTGTTGWGGETEELVGRSSGLHLPLPLGTFRLPRPTAGRAGEAGQRGGAGGKGGAVTPLVPCPRSHVPALQPIAGWRCPESEEAVVRDRPRPEMFLSPASAALVAVASATKTTTATATPRHLFRG